MTIAKNANTANIANIEDLMSKVGTFGIEIQILAMLAIWAMLARYKRSAW